MAETVEPAPFWTVLLLALPLFIGSFLIGSIPLVVQMSLRRLNQVSLLGAGLLVGTAFFVILPEGVDTLYDLARETNAFDPRTYFGVAVTTGFTLMLLLEHYGQSAHQHGRTAFPHHHHVVATTPPRGDATPDARAGSPPSSSGRTLLRLGTVAGGVAAPPSGRVRPFVTLGLVVHAAVDGVALGAASGTTQPALKAAVFVAIMLHKGPSAFGLTSFLLHQGMTRNAIRRHLLLFSIAAPASALLAYALLTSFTSASAARMQLWTGVMLLFSAGTFIYVAIVDILPSIYNHDPALEVSSADAGSLAKSHHRYPGAFDGRPLGDVLESFDSTDHLDEASEDAAHPAATSSPDHSHSSLSSLFILLLGMLIPFPLAFLHSHHH